MVEGFHGNTQQQCRKFGDDKKRGSKTSWTINYTQTQSKARYQKLKLTYLSVKHTQLLIYSSLVHVVGVHSDPHTGRPKQCWTMGPYRIKKQKIASKIKHLLYPCVKSYRESKYYSLNVHLPDTRKMSKR